MPPRLDAFDAIGLDELDGPARLQQRHDRKYVLDESTLDALLGQMADTHHVLEVAGERLQELRTTYFDTPDLTTYREHVQGRRRRFKCRHRRYESTGDAVWEIKLKGRRGRTEKHALPAAGSPRLDARVQTFLRDRLRDAYGRELPLRLEPALTVQATRVTLAAPDLGERVTCDVALVAGEHALAPGSAIVESKSDGPRATCDELLRALGARPVTSCSKYCLGLALQRPELPRAPMLPLLRRHFVPAGRRRALDDHAEPLLPVRAAA